MIRSLTVDGYKGLLKTSVQFNLDGPTVLLGPNGSGKTTILEAVATLAELASKEIGQTALAPDKVERVAYRGESGHEFAFRALMTTPEDKSGVSGSVIWELEVRQGRITCESVGGSPQIDSNGRSNEGLADTVTAPYFTTVARPPQDPRRPWFAAAGRISSAVGPVRIARFLPRRIAESCPPAPRVDPDGFRLPAALLHLLTSDRRQFMALQDRFTKLFPWVDEVLPELGTDEKQHAVVNLKFRERGSRHPYPAEHLSSGMLLTLALLWVTMRSEPDHILCFEEPENSMHPYLLREAYELFGQASRGELVQDVAAKDGKAPVSASKVQVIIATHSVDFVNLCKPEEVRICERDDEGVVKVHAVADQAGLAETLKSYDGALGELWYSGALGGIPKNRPAAGSR